MIKITIDPKDILDLCLDEEEKAKKQLIKSVGDLANAAKKHLTGLVEQNTNTHLSQMFANNTKLESESVTVHVITISGNAVLIDDGQDIDMKTENWLWSSSKTKQGKNGRYLVIPFKQGGNFTKEENPSESTKFQSQLKGRIKEELDIQNKVRKAQGLPKITMGGIERDEKGQIKEGKLHTFNIFGSRKKPFWSNGPLQGLSVYQKIQKDEQGNAKLNKKGEVKASRSWMTFRTASEGKPEKFIYPVPKDAKYLERTAEWAEQEFYNKIVPAIVEKWGD
jgi:hypothetical protein